MSLNPDIQLSGPVDTDIARCVDKIDAGLDKAVCQAWGNIIGKKEGVSLSLPAVPFQLQEGVFEPRYAKASLDLVEIHPLSHLCLQYQVDGQLGAVPPDRSVLDLNRFDRLKSLEVSLAGLEDLLVRFHGVFNIIIRSLSVNTKKE